MKNTCNYKDLCRWLLTHVSTVPRALGAARRDDAGFSLIEVLVVLGIIALLASLVGPQLIRYLGGARSETANTQINNLISAVELYALDVGDYPPQDPGLKALTEAPPQVSPWNGPYLKKSGGLLDPWGRPYLYRFPGQHGAFDIYSLGRDGQEGGEGEDKDLMSW